MNPTLPRSGWRCCAPILVACSLGGAALADTDPTATAAPSATVAATPAFAREDAGITHRLAVGLGAVFLIALISAALVVAARRYGALRGLLLQPRGQDGLRTLAVRRVNSRLTVVKIQISNELAVVIADNGHAICKLAEVPVAPTDRATP